MKTFFILCAIFWKAHKDTVVLVIQKECVLWKPRLHGCDDKLTETQLHVRRQQQACVLHRNQGNVPSDHFLFSLSFLLFLSVPPPLLSDVFEDFISPTTAAQTLLFTSCNKRKEVSVGRRGGEGGGGLLVLAQSQLVM